MQETGDRRTPEGGGGRNIYGHDDGMPFWGAGHVTEGNYAEYVAQRDSFDPPHCQGVGPTQLTSKSRQDAADAAGGCWRPLVNMHKGFSDIAADRARGLTWRQCWLNYSGGKETYADQMDARLAQWKLILNPT